MVTALEQGIKKFLDPSRDTEGIEAALEALPLPDDPRSTAKTLVRGAGICTITPLVRGVTRGLMAGFILDLAYAAVFDDPSLMGTGQQAGAYAGGVVAFTQAMQVYVSHASRTIGRVQLWYGNRESE